MENSGSNTDLKFDIVDFTAPDAAERFTKSLRELGFAVLENHPIPMQMVQAVYEHWLAFFNTDEKFNYKITTDTQDGYIGMDQSEVAKGHKVKDTKEMFHFYPWGQCPPFLRDELMSYYKKGCEVTEQLLSWVEKHSPPEVKAKYSERLTKMLRMPENGERHLLRILHYPPITGKEEPGAIRAAAHEDINLLTILPAASEPGLQVLTKENTWLDVPCDSTYLIVNTGDMLDEASGGYFKSTTHRVVNPEVSSAVNKSRMALPFFQHARADVVLSERHTSQSYLEERLRELGLRK